MLWPPSYECFISLWSNCWCYLLKVAYRCCYHGFLLWLRWVHTPVCVCVYRFWWCASEPLDLIWHGLFSPFCLHCSSWKSWCKGSEKEEAVAQVPAHLRGSIDTALSTPPRYLSFCTAGPWLLTGLLLSPAGARRAFCFCGHVCLQHDSHTSLKSLRPCGPDFPHFFVVLIWGHLKGCFSQKVHLHTFYLYSKCSQLVRFEPQL